MASRTQLRLGQITGSFGTSAINDQVSAAATGSINATSIEGVLSHLAGAIKRVHGQDSFSENTTTGEFKTTIQPSTDDGFALGSANKNWSDLFLADGAVINLGDDQDVKLTHVADKGILLTGTGLNQLAFRDADLVISSSADGTLDIEADTQINIGTDRSGIAISLGNATSEVTVNDNLTVAGNLTVQGDTVQVDVAKLTVEDPIIELARSNGGDTLDIGFVGKYNDGANDLYAGLFRDQNDSGNFHLFKDTQEDLTAATTINRGATGYAKASLIVDSLDADGGVTIDNITIDGTEIALSSGNLTVDADGGAVTIASLTRTVISSSVDTAFNFKGTEFGRIKVMDQGGGNYGGFVLSSSADNGLVLSSNDNLIEFAGGDYGVDSNDLQFNLSQGGQARISVGQNASGYLEVLRLLSASNPSTTPVHFFSGSLELRGGSNAAELRFYDAFESNYVSFKAPDIDSNVSFTLPSADGTNGQVLKSNGSGVLSFGDALGDLSKGVYVMTASHAAGVAFATNTNGNKTAGSDAVADLTESDAQGKSLDVFVNGQLLVSGSEGQRSAGERDYVIAAATTIAFAFALEADDVVQVIKR